MFLTKNNKILFLILTFLLIGLICLLSFASFAQAATSPISFRDFCFELGFNQYTIYPLSCLSSLGLISSWSNTSSALGGYVMSPVGVSLSSFDLGSGDEVFYLYGSFSTVYDNTFAASSDLSHVEIVDGATFYWASRRKVKVDGVDKFGYLFRTRCTVSGYTADEMSSLLNSNDYFMLSSVYIDEFATDLPSSTLRVVFRVYSLITPDDFVNIPFDFTFTPYADVNVPSSTSVTFSDLSDVEDNYFSLLSDLPITAAISYRYYSSALSSVDAAYNNGYNAGYDKANTTITDTSASYTAGYKKGVENAGKYTFSSLLGAVIDVPLNAFTSMFNFEILGVNLTSFLTSLLVIALVLMVLKIVFSFI